MFTKIHSWTPVLRQWALHAIMINVKKGVHIDCNVHVGIELKVCFSLERIVMYVAVATVASYLRD